MAMAEELESDVDMMDFDGDVDDAAEGDTSEFEGFYHVNIIDQFKLNVPCQVELVRINKYG